MRQPALGLDTWLPYAIGAVAVAIVYFAFTLASVRIPAPAVPAAAPVAALETGETVHIGRAAGETKDFTIDVVSVDGRQQALNAGEPRASFSVAKAADIVVTGWALDSRDGRPASRVAALVDGDVTIGPVTVDRPDVAASLHLAPSNAKSGFHLTIPTADLDAGVHHVRFLIVSADGDSVLNAASSLDFVKR